MGLKSFKIEGLTWIAGLTGLPVLLLLIFAAVIMGRANSPYQPAENPGISDNIPKITASDNFPLVITVTPTLLPSPTSISTPIATVKLTPTATKAPTVTKTPVVTPTLLVTPPRDYSVPWQVGPNCPASTQSCVPCTSGTTCRFEPDQTPGQAHGFLGWSCQDNNPGNIRNASTNMTTDFKNLIIIRNGGTPACGVRYDSRGGSYFVFTSYNAGWSALEAYIKGINNGEHSAYTGCGDCTLNFFFSKWAGDTGPYAAAVGAEIGVDPATTTLRTVVNTQLDAFAEAIKHHEGWITN